ncbi:MAG TPA: ABC transporter substrate-binding protein, partial [Reyranella sp.]|nr:ABC transporter substrate-binding protein [Reyranella sp.]
DYAYGRDTTKQYLEFFKKFKPDVEVITEAWPKLGQPDLTEVITKLIQAKPQALFTLLYAGDLSAFINQGNVYALFSQMTVATPNVDYPVLSAIKSLPAGIQSATRYLDTFPDTPANKEFGETYHKKFKELPTNWSWQTNAAMHFVEAAVKKANSTDGKKAAAELTGLKIDSPFGVNVSLTMRDDHTLVDYAIGWGQTVPKPPYIANVKPADWSKIAELETEWKKQQHYI